jgi:hypothetical protein
MKGSSMAIFEVGGYKYTPTYPLGLLATQKAETPLWDPKFELPPLFLFLREDLSFLECATFKQEHLTLSLDDLIAFVTLGDLIP